MDYRKSIHSAISTSPYKVLIIRPKHDYTRQHVPSFKKIKAISGDDVETQPSHGKLQILRDEVKSREGS